LITKFPTVKTKNTHTHSNKTVTGEVDVCS
jgi:hypothetical protein